jgi:hypothetical protein
MLIKDNGGNIIGNAGFQDSSVSSDPMAISTFPFEFTSALPLPWSSLFCQIQWKTEEISDSVTVRRIG